MRILYIAKHGSGGNDDEGSIAFALENLGHEVTCVLEGEPARAYARFGGHSGSYDFCLFHKWGDVESLKLLKCPKVFWYFDLVDWPSDPSLRSRCEARKRWMEDVIPLVDVGFCTDGDWVETWNNPSVGGIPYSSRNSKLVTLRQGADERVVGFGSQEGKGEYADVLFVGGAKGCGSERESFVRELQERYGDRFAHVTSVYREGLRDLVAGAKVVVCPDSPVTDRYWSNRVYTMLGFGAFVLHQYAGDLGKEFRGLNAGLVTYQDRNDLFLKIDFFLNEESSRQRFSERGLLEVEEKFLYRHRCEEMLRVLKERGICG